MQGRFRAALHRFACDQVVRGAGGGPTSLACDPRWSRDAAYPLRLEANPIQVGSEELAILGRWLVEQEVLRPGSPARIRKGPPPDNRESFRVDPGMGIPV